MCVSLCLAGFDITLSSISINIAFGDIICCPHRSHHSRMDSHSTSTYSTHPTPLPPTPTHQSRLRATTTYLTTSLMSIFSPQQEQEDLSGSSRTLLIDPNEGPIDDVVFNPAHGHPPLRHDEYHASFDEAEYQSADGSDRPSDDYSSSGRFSDPQTPLPPPSHQSDGSSVSSPSKNQKKKKAIDKRSLLLPEPLSPPSDDINYDQEPTTYDPSMQHSMLSTDSRYSIKISKGGKDDLYGSSDSSYHEQFLEREVSSEAMNRFTEDFGVPPPWQEYSV